MSTRFTCTRQRRRDLVRAALGPGGVPRLNGIDYLEVSETDGSELVVRFLHPLPGQPGGVPAAPVLDADNFVIDGGTRITGIRVDAVVSTAGDTIVLHTSAIGDFTTYTLRLRSSAAVAVPPLGFDPHLADVAFSYRIECDDGRDCATTRDCAPATLDAPHLSYLAKDYASFRRLILDRLSVVMPDWNERSAADVGVTLVELLAYTGDHLSYYQDAVGGEAYLGTARRRTSVRRHARLVDYPMHDGCNARAWLVLEADADRGDAVAPALPAGRGVTTADGDVWFETMHDVERLLVARNAIAVHTWSDDDCCLRAGATAATLRGAPAVLGLSAGDVLVFEQVRSNVTGRAEDADRTRRQAVRLAAAPVGAVDPLTSQAVSHVRWFADDALAFPLWPADLDDGQGGTRPAVVARGNVVLADHGRGVDADLVPPIVPAQGAYRPVVLRGDVTQAAPFDVDVARTRSARDAMTTEPRQAVAAVWLRGEDEPWNVTRDLLGSDRFATRVVAEADDDGRMTVRFGDGVRGRRPVAGSTFTATARIGGGVAGNVGAEALCVLAGPLGEVTVRNPLPASGGCLPEPIRQVQLDAPQAFRTQERAVTAADYGRLAELHAGVQRAAATRRWTGSWYTMFVTVDRLGGLALDAAFEDDLRRHLDAFRMAGYDIEIDGPRDVPLELELTLCVEPGHDAAVVESELRDVLSARQRPGHPPGFFHPDNFTFGQPVYLSRIIAAVAAVDGVERVVSVDAFHRAGELPHGEIEQGYVPIHRLEIARLDGNRSNVEHGSLTLHVRGGGR